MTTATELVSRHVIDGNTSQLVLEPEVAQRYGLERVVRISRRLIKGKLFLDLDVQAAVDPKSGKRHALDNLDRYPVLHITGSSALIIFNVVVNHERIATYFHPAAPAVDVTIV